MSELNTYIRSSLWTPETKLWTPGKWQKGHSFVANFMKMWLASADVNTNQTITDTGGTARAIFDHALCFSTAGGTGSVFGIVVGTNDGATVVALTDTALDTLIVAGTSSGQLDYAAPTYTDPTDDASTTEFEIHRGFTNSSGASITIKEVGLYVAGASTPWYIMIIREILSAPRVVADDEAVNMDLRIQISLS